MLRYITTYQEQGVTIQDEVACAEHYLELMKERYPDHLTYSLDVKPEALAIPIPKLMLQPLVENCFQHAFATIAPPWRIEVKAWLDESHWHMQVKDNGSGFDRETLVHLLRKTERFSGDVSAGLSESKPGGLGLHHTIVRLKLLHGGAMRFTVASGEPRGSIITIGGPRHDPSAGG
ncbi:sensor histidine kinase [Cohnella rhizosphaerae]|uniref:sensor histidine kinase n=1 Tax=Cohnella rhizosphaerae TaxID=1457232 RepID=UPI003B8A95B2